MRTAVAFLALVAGLAFPPSSLAQTTEQTLYVSVLDQSGRPVGGLDVDDFIVREDGVSREVLRAGRTSDPIDLAIIVDNSFAAQPHILDIRQALTAFTSRMAGQNANIAIIGMADRPTVLSEYTGSVEELKRGIQKIFAQPNSGMVFQDTIVETVRGLARRDNPRRAILVITGEGRDFSNVPYENTLDTLESSGIAFHVIQLTSRTGAPIRDQEARERSIVIDQGTRATGGRRHDVLTSMAYADALSEVAEDLANQYKVVYGRSGALVPPKKVEVSVAKPGLTARGTLVRQRAGGTK